MDNNKEVYTKLRIYIIYPLVYIKYVYILYMIYTTLRMLMCMYNMIERKIYISYSIISYPLSYILFFFVFEWTFFFLILFALYIKYENVFNLRSIMYAHIYIRS